MLNAWPVYAAGLHPGLKGGGGCKGSRALRAEPTPARSVGGNGSAINPASGTQAPPNTPAPVPMQTLFRNYELTCNDTWRCMSGLDSRLHANIHCGEIQIPNSRRPTPLLGVNIFWDPALSSAGFGGTPVHHISGISASKRC